MRRSIVSTALALIGAVAWTGAWAAGPDAKAGKAKYTENMRCSSCHGETGAGDGPAAVALNPKPRNFKDCKYMETRTDADLFNVIKEGGAAAKPKPLSPLMVSFKSQLNDDEIKNVVAYIRSLPKPACKVKKK
jgi:cytochrome c553